QVQGAGVGRGARGCGPGPARSHAPAQRWTSHCPADLRERPACGRLRRPRGRRPQRQAQATAGRGRMSDADKSKDRVAEFTAFRQRMNERILAEDNQVVRRFFALDTQTYKPGALDVKTKELLG